MPPAPNTPSDDFDSVLRELARLPAVKDPLVVAVDGASPVLGDALREAVDLARGASAEPQPGALLDERFRVLDVLGRGGMGVVLEAETISSGKRVAIKWMHGNARGDRSPAVVARFLREARAVGAIRHPNVVDLYEVGNSDGVPFLVLERLHGESLRARIARGPLSWSEAQHVMLGVLRGVSAVHQAGIVHRDLKPDNIFLCSSDNHGLSVPKVLDFGVVAMRQTSQDGQDSMLTRTGALLGTPAYMAPEQLTSGSVDARSDVYALGVMLYEMLSGVLPFAARTAAELAVLQATSDPPRLAGVRPRLDRAQEQAILRALARKPSDRYPNAEAFSSALEACRRSGSRRNISLALMVGLALCVAGGATYYAWRAEQRDSPVVSAPKAEAARGGAPQPEPSSAPSSVAAEIVAPLAAEAPQAEVSAPIVKPRPVETAPRARRARAPAVPEPAPRQTGEIRLEDF